MNNDPQQSTSSLITIRRKHRKLYYCFFLLLFLIILIISLALLCLQYGHEGNPDIIKNKIHELFQSKKYTKLYKKLNKNGSRLHILVGKRIDGVQFFVSKFVNTKINEGYNIKLREYQESRELELQNHQFFTLGSNFINKYIFKQKNLKNNYWIIYTQDQLNQTAYKKIEQISLQNKQDQILIVSEKNIKKNGFSKISFQRPSNNAIQQYLKRLKLNRLAIKNILSYHQNDLRRINSLINEEDPVKSFRFNFNEQIQNIQDLISNSTKQKKIQSILNQICQLGKFRSKKSLSFLQNTQVLSFYHKAYYWAHPKYIYAFSIINHKQCITDVQFHLNLQNTQLIAISQQSSTQQIKQQSSNKKDQQNQ